MKVTAIIVTYNRVKLLKSCIKGLLNQKSNLNKIVIVNNNSTDGTKDYLNSLHNNIILTKNLAKNIGGAGGFSVGTELAYEQTSSKYFWLMDDDTIPSTTALSELCKYAKKLHGHFGFLSSNVRWWGNNKATNVPTVASDWSELSLDSLIKLKEATFVSFFVPRYRVKELGLPIAENFIWGDDTEYTHRIARKYPSYFVPSSIVYHNSKKMDNNENVFNEGLNRIPFYRFRYRNLLYFNKKYYSYKGFLKDLVIFTCIFFEIPFKSKNHRLLRMYYTFMGIIQGFYYNPKIRFPKDLNKNIK